MRPIQLDLYSRNQNEIVKSICENCDRHKRIKDFRSVRELIKITPLLNKLYQK
jgi:hypothetical protein